MSDDSNQRAIEGGKRNADGFVLVKNWCAHVRIERFGGVGMIEQATGLPIGHHGLACDHAPSSGIMSWDIRDAALDFYDRNCKQCPLRQPVGLPNLLNWVAERDAELARQQTAENADAERAARALAERRSERLSLSAGLSPPSADVIEQIDELDHRRAEDLVNRLVETAHLAPDVFTPEIIEYAFHLLETNERWFDEAGLKVLASLGADAPRLARCAMHCLQRHSAIHTAAGVLLARLSVADGTLVPAILPTVIRMASPARDPFVSARPPKIATLVKLSAAFPEQVAGGLERLLEGSPSNVSLAACAIQVLISRNPELALRFTRALISKFVRAKWLPAPWDYGHANNESVARDLQASIVATFIRSPDAVDGLLRSFRLGAAEAGEVRVFSVYGGVLHRGRFQKSRPIGSADQLALRRLLEEAPKTSSDRVLSEIQGVISGDPYELVDLVRREVDSLLGAAIFMDERITQFDTQPTPPKSGMLDALERQNRRATLTSLRDSFVGWAAHGAAANENYSGYLDVLKNLPEARDNLAASMLKQAVTMMESVAGLNAVLPFLYSALVGISVARRGSAARAVGEIPWRQRDNLPELLWEAFLTSLADPYRYVHKSAIRALDRADLPKKFNGRIRRLVWTLFLEYADTENEEDIALKCIDLLVTRYLTSGERTGEIGALIIAKVRKMPAWRIRSGIERLSRQLAGAEGLVDLLISLLVAADTQDSGADHVLNALADLPVEVIHANRAKLGKLSVGDDRRGRFWLLHVVEILSASRAWAEAEHLCASAVAAIPATTRERPVRLLFELVHAAARIESALACSDWEAADQCAKQWRELKVAKEADDRERAERPDPFRNFRGAPGRA